MMGQNIINSIGLDRAISTHSISKNTTESQSILLNQAHEFGVDAVYFNTDKDKNSFPAIFLKKVKYFGNKTLKEIADTHRKVWNFKKVLFLYVYSETEIRIYNCSAKPLIITAENFDYEIGLKNIEIKAYTFSDKQNLQELNKLFSTISIDTGIIWTLEEAYFIRKKINLQKKVDKYLVESLVNTAQQLEEKGLEINLIHKIILRSLFLLYLEDRKATDENFYSKIKKGTKSYFDILDDVEATYNLFKKLEDHFNGNVFTLEKGENISPELLQLIKKCFICGNDNTQQEKLFKDWRLFDFSIIQIELLSEIYENFLFETDPELKKKTGTYYTPPSLVEFILNEKLPINKGENNYNIKVLDPSCGSGIFLVESFKRLVKRYENKHNEKLTDFNKLKKLLTDNIFGIELHPQAIKVCAFSLYLALLDNLNPKTIWQNKAHRLPYLINNPNDKTLEKQGNNLFCRDTIEVNKEIENIEFDLVVGNPPFGTTDLLETVKNYCNKYNFAKEMVLPFLHKATQFTTNGEIALIFNTKVLTNTGSTYQNFRKWMFNECYVEKVYNFSILRNAPENFGGQLFGSATGPISIVFYQKEKPKKTSNKILYYAPKTYIKSNIIEGLSIDFTDLKYLPREECQKPDTKIWKITMWGGINDFNLINSIDIKFTQTISDYLNTNIKNFFFGSGLHLPSEKQIETNKTFKPREVINLRKVQRYYTKETSLERSEKIFRHINQNIFSPPYILIKEGQKNKEYCASYIDYLSFHTGYSISPINSRELTLVKLWCSLINSSFAKYFLSLTSASWGIERERVQANETLILPALVNIDEKTLIKFELKFNKLISYIKEDFSSVNIHEIEREIDSFIYKYILKLSVTEINQINDVINYSIDLFENKEKSKALFPVIKDEIKSYGIMLSNELNDFLDGQELFVNTTIYNIDWFTPLMMIKLSFGKEQKEIFQSKESVDEELKKLDKHLWKEKATNIYFRKKLNYKIENDIYIIRPNQRRFWSQSMALEDASELILEILNGN